MKSNEVSPSNSSKGDAENQEIDSCGKLPQLYEDDGSGNKSKARDGFTFATDNHQVHTFDALFLDTTPPLRSYEHKMQELADIESQYSELIKQHAQAHQGPVQHEASGLKISTEAVIRLGGERFIQSCSSTSSMNDISIASHPYGSSFTGLSDQEVKDVQLIENLLLSAEKVTHQQYERSIKLLDWCDDMSCSSGTPIQRLVHYFSKALREKVDKETGRASSGGSGKKDVENLVRRVALVDGVSGSKNVHVIDLSIKQGTHCTILMQALVSQLDYPIEHLKITSVGTTSKQKIEQTGDWLKSFAESINLSFSYNVVIVEDMLDFNKDYLELDPDEALGVYTSYGLWSMIGQQDRLDSLMNVIKSINPCVMVVSEAAANLNSPNFVNRFIEGLFYYGAMFDSFEECLGREDENRTITESMYFAKGINNVVASEGTERVIRHVHINVWRKFFARFGMKETELSMSSLYQANLVAEKFSNGSCCTFDRDGDSLVIGWKGTPIEYVTAWKFS
ncbi:putative transcription factor GRAS family [Helianthus debilis subsp. tardiflorus]